MLLLWRVSGGVLRSPRVATAGLVTVVALPLVILGPLHRPAPLWDAANVSETLSGTVTRNGTQLKQIVSFVGQAQQPQKLLVRADLLVSPQGLDSTSFQVEYLPSGDICRGHVSGVGGTSFSGTCRLPNGKTRSVDASWIPNESQTGVVGSIKLQG